MSKVTTAAFGGRHSPSQTLINAQEAHSECEFRNVMVIAIDKDNEVHLAHSDGSRLEAIGLLEIAKDSIVRDLAYK